MSLSPSGMENSRPGLHEGKAALPRMLIVHVLVMIMLTVLTLAC